MSKMTYNSIVAKCFDVSHRVGPMAGIELEYEGVNAAHVPHLDYWHTEIDHSLRTGGLEFVSYPTGPDDLSLALAEVKAALIDTGAHISKRCGVHVHLNVADLTMAQVWQIATLYTAVEPFIFKQFADGREDSHFCVPMWSNTNLHLNMYEDATKLHRGVSLRGVKSTGGSSYDSLLQPSESGPKTRVPLRFVKNAKYSACNFQSLCRFGTLEFRQHYATTDMRKVKKWVLFLFNLREVALKYNNPEEIAHELLTEGFTPLLTQCELEENPDVNPEYLSDAVDAVCMIVGHPPTDPNSLSWEIS